MSSSMQKVSGYAGHTDLFKIDPRKIVIVEEWNPRSALGDLADLKASIRDNGFYADKALLLYRRGADLELVSGHRRLSAVLELIAEGVPIVSIPAVLDQTGDEGERFARALSANQNGVPLDPMDEASAFKRLVGYGWESKRIATKIGRSLSYVYGRLKLLEAETDVLDAAVRGEITHTDIVRTVERAGKEGVSQSQALDVTKQKRRAQKKAASSGWSSPEALAEDDERRLKNLLDEHGVAWVVQVLLTCVDKEAVLDAIHDFAEVQ